MATILELCVAGTGGDSRLTFPVARVYNLGFTMRDASKMQAHLDEVAREGVTPPSTDNPPLIFPISPWTTVTGTDVPVQYGTTSGEIEIVTLILDDDLYVGVGSDHTDRKLEAVDIPWSKQVAPNVLAPTVWRWSEVEAHWNEILLESYVSENGEWVLYQKAGVAEFWTPPEMRTSLEGRIVPVSEGGLLLFSGTVVSTEQRLSYAPEWTIIMSDPVLGRRIEHTYRVTVLSEEILIP